MFSGDQGSLKGTKPAQMEILAVFFQETKHVGSADVCREAQPIAGNHRKLQEPTQNRDTTKRFVLGISSALEVYVGISLCVLVTRSYQEALQGDISKGGRLTIGFRSAIGRQQLKGTIVSEFFTPFHTLFHICFSEFFPPGLSPSKQRVLAQ